MSLRRALFCEIEESNPCPPNIQRLPEASVQVEPPQREPGAVAMDPGPAIGVPVPSVPYKPGTFCFFSGVISTTQSPLLVVNIGRLAGIHSVPSQTHRSFKRLSGTTFGGRVIL